MTDMSFIPDDKNLERASEPSGDKEGLPKANEDSFFPGADPLANYEDDVDAPGILTDRADLKAMEEAAAQRPDLAEGETSYQETLVEQAVATKTAQSLGLDPSKPLVELKNLSVAFESSTGMVPAVREANITIYPRSNGCDRG